MEIMERLLMYYAINWLIAYCNKTGLDVQKQNPKTQFRCPAQASRCPESGTQPRIITEVEGSMMEVKQVNGNLKKIL